MVGGRSVTGGFYFLLFLSLKGKDRSDGFTGGLGILLLYEQGSETRGVTGKRRDRRPIMIKHNW